MKKSIEFTKEEAAQMTQLLDIAIKSGWLSVAQVAVSLAIKFGETFKENDEGFVK